MRGFMRNVFRLALACFLPVPWIPAAPAEPVPQEIVPGLQFVPGPVNGAWLARNGKRLAVYGDPREQATTADLVLFTHHRRDVVWAGQHLLTQGARAVVPAAEVEQFTEVRRFWSEFETKRFHDYTQQSTKILREPLTSVRPVRGGETLTWEGLALRVLDTPGYTRGAVTYLVELDGRRLAFTGDLIYGDGKILDLYSLQDAIPAAKIGGYHGYAARLGDVVASLQKVAAEKPDLLVPARGPIIRNPVEAMETLTSRIRALYSNYLSIDALRWYFKDDHIMAKARRVLGPGAKVNWMPMAETAPALPAWIVPIDNARLIVSSDKTGFLVDCGSQHIIDELMNLRAAGKLSSVEHVFITHYHDDHTDAVSKLVENFGCAVHASPQNRDVLENPGAYRLPCLTRNPIRVTSEATNRTRWRWKEFELTLYYFPGQTIYHDALLVKRDQGEEIFFIGDSFTPSGIDDYCLLNRNLLLEGKGFFGCLDLVRREAPQAWLINQHVEPAFRFSDSQIAHMQAVLQQRVTLLENLLPWDDPNFGLDESWARFYPYALRVPARESFTLSLRIMNHAPIDQTFAAHLHLPDGWTLPFGQPGPVRIGARAEGAVAIRVALPETASPGTHVLTADLRTGGWDLREWTEAMVTVTSENR
jgi:glyoxylase-like metal-dependent hydrolase (beta-lactamase superfamily II)